MAIQDVSAPYRAHTTIVAHPCHEGCMQAHTQACTCACGGTNHGVWIKAYRVVYSKKAK